MNYQTIWGILLVLTIIYLLYTLIKFEDKKTKANTFVKVDEPTGIQYHFAGYTHATTDPNCQVIFSHFCSVEGVTAKVVSFKDFETYYISLDKLSK